ncbi:MAG: hypothetical protein RLZZ591_2644 [Pseudomonadota bacterium]|jgi:putative ABC transport system permease protein
MQALDKKVLRDLRLMWSQAITIALVVASGVGGFMASLSAVESLSLAREHFYQSNRFADVFVSLKRAPLAVLERVRLLPGVADAHATVESGARVSVPGSPDPVVGQLIGLDERTQTGLNQVSLRAGIWPRAAGSDLEALISEGFANAHGLRVGDAVTALVNGKRRRLVICGIALSPEYVFAGLMGMPDVRSFGVFWVDARSLAGAIDMQGAFNHVALRLQSGASESTVREALDRLLAPYGAQVARGRSEQSSHAMLDNEIKEQRVLGTLLPSIFLAVAAFLLHVVVARLVATQREQVAALKALGYGNASIATHYLKLVFPIVTGGYLMGQGLGQWLGAQITRLYADFFHFGTFEHQVPPRLMAISLLIVLATALLGTLSAVAATVRLSPAEAMQPPAPGRYRRALLERLPWLQTHVGLRMILRNLERRRLRALLTTSGIAAAVAIVIMGNFLRDAIESIVDVSFNLALRSDIVVWTTQAVPLAAGRELAALPGVRLVEPGRGVAVRFVNGHRAESGVLQGYAEVPELRRVIDLNKHQVTPGGDGVLMTDRLANKLGLRVGDWVKVEVREGDRRVRQVLLERTVSDMMGLNAYMSLGALNRLLGEEELASLFSLAVDSQKLADVLQATQALPRIAGAFSKASMLSNMQEISARNILVMSTILTLFAGVIAVGVVYNNARIALAERSWELASLRVLGFTRAEVSALLLGELALTIAIALPLGMLLGRAFTALLVSLIRSDQFSFPVVILPRTYAWAALCVLIAGAASALVVRRRIDQLDMVSVLKTRE